MEKEHKQIENFNRPANKSPTNKTFVINNREILTFLSIAEEVQTALLDSHTFYLCDLSIFQETEYNSLIFQIDGKCFKSMEKTAEIVDRFALMNQLPYLQLQKIGKMVGITQKCPYIIGNYYFAPDRGTTKNQANWIALHHVLYYEGDRSSSHFVFHNKHELRLPLSEESIQKMVERVCILCKLNEIIVYRWIKSHFAFSQLASINNVVHENLKVMNYNGQFPSYYQIMDQLIFIKATEIAAKILGEPNLTIDELSEYYPSWFGHT